MNIDRLTTLAAYLPHHKRLSRSGGVLFTCDSAWLEGSTSVIHSRGHLAQVFPGEGFCCIRRRVLDHISCGAPASPPVLFVSFSFFFFLLFFFYLLGILLTAETTKRMTTQATYWGFGTRHRDGGHRNLLFSAFC